MPLYEYSCSSCSYHFEVIQKFSDDPISLCPNCGHSHAERLLSAPAIQFKGSGWYITDYAKKNSPSASTSTKGTEEKKENSSIPTKTNNSPTESA